MKKILLTILWLLTILMPSVSWAQSSEAYAVLNEDNTVLTFYYDDQRALRNGYEVGSYIPASERGWYSALDRITKVVFDDSFANFRPISTSSWFDGCSALRSIEGIENLKTNNVNDMGSMFFGCSSLTSLDVSSFDTSSLTNMSSMFYGCSGLTSIDLSHFNTEQVSDLTWLFNGCSKLISADLSNFKTDNVYSLYGMFDGCSSLTSVNLSSFNTASVTRMGNMFVGCSNLTTLDLSSFNTVKVSEMLQMFYDCTQLATIYVGSAWTTSAVTDDGESMFRNCTNLVGGAGTTYNSSQLNATYAHIDGGSSNPGYFTDIADKGKVDEAYAVVSSNDTGGKTLTFYYDKKKEERNGMSVGPFNSSNERGWYFDYTITTVVFDDSFANNTTLTSTAWWFADTRITSIVGLSNLNTSNVTSMNNMFDGCSSITSLTISLNTSKVENMSSMFQGCNSLETIEFGNFDTSNVTDMSNMFSGCSQLVSIKNMSFNTEKVQNMQGMFSGCNYLSGVDLSSFNTTSVTNMSEMFSSCMALESLDVTTFNTSNVSNMKSMFYGCQTLTTLDLSSFNTAKVENMNRMLGDCRNLKTIYVSDLWTTGAVNDGADMFLYSTSLEGGSGTTFFVENIDYTYARIDGGPDSETPGYFTDIAEKDKVDEPYAVLSSDNTTLTFYYDKKKEDRNGMDVSTFSSYRNRGWHTNRAVITNVIIDESFASYSPTSTAYWFYGMTQLTSISGLQNLNTSSVTDMKYMFYECQSLQELDFSNFLTSSVTSMAYMFSQCSSLTALDLSAFNTSQVTDMTQMFYHCSSLVTIYASALWSISAVTAGESIFSGCYSLIGGKGVPFNSNFPHIANAHIDGGMSNPGYLTDKNASVEDLAYAALTKNADGNYTLTFYYDTNRLARNGYTVGPLTDYAGYRGWNSKRDSITNVVIDQSFADFSPTSISYWFDQCENIEGIEGLEYLKTDNVQDMICVFRKCAKLEMIDISGFKTPVLETISSLFQGCTALKTIFAGDGWNLDKLSWSSSGTFGAGYHNVFTGCTNLVGGEGTKFQSNWDEATYAHIDGGTSNPGYFTDIADYGKENESYAVLSEENTKLTFYYDKHKEQSNGMSVGPFSSAENRGWNDNASSITSVVFDSSFANDTTLTSTANWFSGMSNLTAIDGLQYLNTKNVTDMVYMFSGCSSLTSLDVTHFNTQNVTNMAAMFNGCSGLTSLDVTGFNTQNVTNIGYMFQNCSGLTSLDVTHFNTQNVWRIDGMFASCSGLTSLDLTGFNTQNVTSMNNMFNGCSGLTSLDLSNFNTQNVTGMNWMFLGCSNLKTIYAGDGWSTAAVSNGNGVFSDCTVLVGGAGTHYDADHTDYTYAHIDGGTSNPGYFTAAGAEPWVDFDPEPYAVLSEDRLTVTFYYDDQRSARGGVDINKRNIDSSSDSPYGTATTAIIDASFANYFPTRTAYWFKKCSSLTNIIGIENLKTANVTDMSLMFSGCSGLTSLDVSGFNTANVTNMSYMFSGCSGLTSLDVSGFNTDNVTIMSGMFSGCSGLTSLDVSGFNTAHVPDMGYMFYDCSGLTSLDVSGFNTANVTYMSSMFENCSSLTSLDVSGFNTDNVTDMSWMFSGCSGLTSLDVSGFNTANVTDMSGMFYGCSGLTSLDVSGFNTANVTSMSYMFSDCSSLTSLDVSGFNTANVTSMRSMFSGCSGLTSLDVSGFNTDNVTDMSWMFSGCSGLTSLDLSGFNTANVTYMSSMFSGCSGLTSLDLSGFNTANVTDMDYMFSGCSGLTSLDVSGFNTANVTYMSRMFYSCSGLTSLDVSGFNTANVTYMDYMFFGCSGLTSLDVSGFNTANVTDMRYMFYGCSGLTSIYVGDGWSTAKVEDSTEMFYDCINLVGGAGTTFDMSYIDYTYAHIDGGASNPGYFTLPLSMGDANGDGDVNIADAVATVTNILGQPADGNFYRYAADMNSDDVIDIFDVSMIVTSVLNTSSPAPARRSATRSSIENIPAEAIQLTAAADRLYLDVDQSQQFTAFQFDMILPEGMSLVDVKLTGMTDHQVSFVQHDSGLYRVIALSMSNEVFRPANGHLVQLQVSNTAGESNVKISNVLFVTPTAKMVTGIGECLNNPIATGDSIYNLKGEKLGTDKQRLGKGIYIMNHKKVIIK